MECEQILQKTCLRSVCGGLLYFACILQQNESTQIVSALKPGCQNEKIYRDKNHESLVESLSWNQSKMNAFGAWDIAQLGECLSTLHKLIDLIFSTT